MAHSKSFFALVMTALLVVSPVVPAQATGWLDRLLGRTSSDTDAPKDAPLVPTPVKSEPVTMEPVTKAPAVSAPAPSRKPNRRTESPAKLSMVLVGENSTATVQRNETLADVAVRLQVGYVSLVTANPDVSPLYPPAGTVLKVPRQTLLPYGWEPQNLEQDHLIIDLGSLQIFWLEQGQDTDPVVHPIGIGREGLATPTGDTHIRTKVKGPSWRPTPRMRKEKPDLPAVVGPGDENPLGDYALYLGWPAYLVHGTQKQHGIGRRVSSGCIRMYDDGIEDLFGRVPKSTAVTVVREPVKLAWVDGRLYLEAEPEGHQVDEVEYQGSVRSLRLDRDVLARIETAAGPYGSIINWDEVDRALRQRHGMPVVIASRDSFFRQALTARDAYQLVPPLPAVKPELSENDRQQKAPRNLGLGR